MPDVAAEGPQSLRPGPWQTLLDHLDLLARNDAAALAKVCGVDAEDMAEMMAEIKALNPKPGLAFGSEVAQTVVPDVFVRAGPTAAGWWN